MKVTKILIGLVLALSLLLAACGQQADGSGGEGEYVPSAPTIVTDTDTSTEE